MAMSMSMWFNSSAIADTDKGTIDIQSIQAEVFKPNEMSEEDRQAYYDAIEKQVELASENYGEGFDKDWFREELIFVLETENSFQLIQSRDYNKVVPNGGTWIPDIKVRNDIAAAAFNVAIDAVLIASGVGTVAAFVKKVGMQEARKIFTNTLTSKLKAWGLGSLAVALPVAVDFIFNFLNPGIKIAQYLDSKDSYPNNGYIDLIL